jgi:hypothetical protein
VFGDIAQRFLNDPKDHDLQGLRNFIFVDIDFAFDADVRTSDLKIAVKPGNGGQDAQIIQDRWP